MGIAVMPELDARDDFAESHDSRPRPTYDDIRDDFDDDFGVVRTPWEIARRKLQGPAIAFIVLGLFGVAGAIIGTIAILLTQSGGAMNSDERLAIMIVCVVLTGFGACLFAVVLIAGINMLRMQHRGLALAAAYIVTGLSIAGLYAILFFPFGIWALIVLYQPDVRREFHRPEIPKV
jgi:hypothetical protein